MESELFMAFHRLARYPGVDENDRVIVSDAMKDALLVSEALLESSVFDAGFPDACDGRPLSTGASMFLTSITGICPSQCSCDGDTFFS